MYSKVIELEECIQNELAKLEREAGQLTHEALEARYGKDPKILLAYYLYGFSKGGWDKAFYCYRRAFFQIENDPAALKKEHAAALYKEKFAEIIISGHNTFLADYLGSVKDKVEMQELPGLIVLLKQVYRAVGDDQALLKKIFTKSAIENIKTIFTRPAKVVAIRKDEVTAYYQELKEGLLEKLAELYGIKVLEA
jgi:hypothetical protein